MDDFSEFMSVSTPNSTNQSNTNMGTSVPFQEGFLGIDEFGFGFPNITNETTAFANNNTQPIFQQQQQQTQPPQWGQAHFGYTQDVFAPQQPQPQQQQQQPQPQPQQQYMPTTTVGFPTQQQQMQPPAQFQLQQQHAGFVSVAPQPQYAAPELQLSTMISVCANISQRIAQIEQNVKRIHTHLMETKTKNSNNIISATHNVTTTNTNISNNNNAATNTNTTAPSATGTNNPGEVVDISALPETLELRTIDLRPTFYADHDFPPFTLNVVDNLTGEVFKDTAGWRFEIHVLDGFGGKANHKLTENKIRFINNGSAVVTGLRFLEVSSKNGNFYSLECRVVFPRPAAHRVGRMRPQKIVIYSSRLYHSHRAALRLRATDPVHKLPHIGVEFALRLKGHGISTIADLACVGVDSSPESTAERAKLLQAIRPEKGCALTEEKLVMCVRMARAVVSGEGVGMWLQGLTQGGQSQQQQRAPSYSSLSFTATTPTTMSVSSASSPLPMSPGGSPLSSPPTSVHTSPRSSPLHFSSSTNGTGGQTPKSRKRKIPNTVMGVEETELYQHGLGDTVAYDETDTSQRYEAVRRLADCGSSGVTIPTRESELDNSVHSAASLVVAATNVPLNHHNVRSSSPTTKRVTASTAIDILDITVSTSGASKDATAALKTAASDDTELEPATHTTITAPQATTPTSAPRVSVRENQQHLTFPLHNAVEAGSLERTQRVVEGVRRRGRSVNETNAIALTPLMVACMLNHAHIAKFLCTLSDVDVWWKRDDEWDALQLAVVAQSVDCVAAILKASPPQAPSQQGAGTSTNNTTNTETRHGEEEGDNTSTNTEWWSAYQAAVARCVCLCDALGNESLADLVRTHAQQPPNSHQNLAKDTASTDVCADNTTTEIQDAASDKANNDEDNDEGKLVNHEAVSVCAPATSSLLSLLDDLGAWRLASQTTA